MKRILFVFLFSFAFVGHADLTNDVARLLQILELVYRDGAVGDVVAETPYTSSSGSIPLSQWYSPAFYENGNGLSLENLPPASSSFLLQLRDLVRIETNELARIVAGLGEITDGWGYRLADTLHSQFDSVEYYIQGLWGHIPVMESRADEHGSELLVAAPDIESVLADILYNSSQSTIISTDTAEFLQDDVIPLLRILVSNMVPTTLQISDAEDIADALPSDLAEDHDTDFEDVYQETRDDLDSTAPDWSEKFTDNPWDYGGNITNRLLNSVLNLVDDVDPVTSPELVIMGSYDTPSALSGAARLPRIAVNLEDSLRRSNALSFATTVMSALWLIVGVFYKFSALQKFVDWYTKKSKGI